MLSIVSLPGSFAGFRVESFDGFDLRYFVNVVNGSEDKFSEIMGWPRCCVEYCGENKRQRFRFPHPKTERFKKWLERIGDEKLNALDPMVVYKNKRICCRHFSLTCFSEGTIKLKNDAEPTRFPRRPVNVVGECTAAKILVNPRNGNAATASTKDDGGSPSMVLQHDLLPDGVPPGQVSERHIRHPSTPQEMKWTEKQRRVCENPEPYTIPAVELHRGIDICGEHSAQDQFTNKVKGRLTGNTVPSLSLPSLYYSNAASLITPDIPVVPSDIEGIYVTYPPLTNEMINSISVDNDSPIAPDKTLSAANVIDSKSALVPEGIENCSDLISNFNDNVSPNILQNDQVVLRSEENEIPALKYLETERTMPHINDCYRYTCRLCFTSNGSLTNIFEEGQEFKISDAIKDLLHFEVSKADEFPHFICSTCHFKLRDFLEFKNKLSKLKDAFEKVLRERRESYCDDELGMEETADEDIREQCNEVETEVVSTQLARQLPEIVRIPQLEEELADFRRRFYQVACFPGVVGCIDGTHIPIISPGGEFPELYRNRKGYFSLNVQVVVGPRMEILDIVCRWPGSTHDARIFHNSRLRLRFDSNEINGILLGDSGYPQMRYLYTPVRNPATAAERYNTSHIATRSTVERAFGVWKRRFPCLSMKLRTATRTSAKIILACAVLHNVAVKHREPVPEQLLRLVPPADVPLPAVRNQNPRAAVERRVFIQRHFGHGSYDSGEANSNLEGTALHELPDPVIDVGPDVEELTLQSDYRCNDCGEVFKFRNLLAKHQREHRKMWPMSCQYCGKRFRSLLGLNGHIIIHSNYKPYECEHCGLRCRWKSTLIQHKLIHSGEKPFLCSVCGISFRNCTLLMAHMRMHSDIKCYKCEECGAEFPSNRKLSTHLVRHEKKRSYKCGDCGKSFSKRVSLSNHVVSVHRTEKRFQCNICLKRFSIRQYLNGHMKIHDRGICAK